MLANILLFYSNNSLVLKFLLAAVIDGNVLWVTPAYVILR